jgi:hypothetical protein
MRPKRQRQPRPAADRAGPDMIYYGAYKPAGQPRWHVVCVAPTRPQCATAL